MIRLQILRRCADGDGSQHLINGQRIMLECGMYHGKRAEAYERNRNFPFDPKSINRPFCPNLHLREQRG
jgi:metallo-beta-lactamase family protein